jgi:hypothetical protein
VLESVATVIERTAITVIQDWYERALHNETLMAISVSRDVRCSHLPRLLRDVVSRLRFPTICGTEELFSQDAAEHGRARLTQGYSAAIMVEEARLMKISIFQSLHDNLDQIDCRLLLPDLATIADEVDAQLSRSVACYSPGDLPPRLSP